VLAAAEVALRPDDPALVVHDDHGVVPLDVAGTAEVVDALSGAVTAGLHPRES
jgi:hypothetical protein